MTEVCVNAQTWELPLLRLALDGSEAEPLDAIHSADRIALADAYAYCDDVAREHSQTFYTASQLLPVERRRAVRALYAFCRVTDDLVDRSRGEVAGGLATWRQRVMANPPRSDDAVALAWYDTRRRYGIPARYASQLMRGVAADLTVTRYNTFEDLASYCYGVASTVGLMSMHIVGFRGPEAIPYAVKLGIAMQVANILRDVREDWAAGRLYLPLDELAVFGLDESAVANGRVTQRWRAFMRFQVSRNRELYAEAMPGIAWLDTGGRFAIAAAAELYRALLDEIEAHDGDVFNHRAKLPAWDKLRRLPGIYWRSRRSKL